MSESASVRAGVTPGFGISQIELSTELEPIWLKPIVKKGNQEWNPIVKAGIVTDNTTAVFQIDNAEKTAGIIPTVSAAFAFPTWIVSRTSGAA